jgi:acetyl-CoA C-acetyltransferase
MFNEAVIVSAVRTPVGKYGGSLKSINSGVLASTVISEALNRISLSPELVDEVIMGEVRQTTESSNVARVAALRAGIPVEASAFSVNRLCASGMQAIASAVQEIAFDQAQIVVAGGTENMSKTPIYLRNSRFGEGNPYLVDANLEAGQQPSEIYGNQLGMGITAENVAQQFKISREDQDAFAVESQKKAVAAIRNGRFDEEIVPVVVKEKKNEFIFSQDEHPRADTTFEKLATLKPAFHENGTVTAGNACGRNDGAAALVIMSKEKAYKLGLRPLALIKDWTTAGVDPRVMGIGPVPAVNKLVSKTGISLNDIGVIEINEAFASQSLAVIQELNLNMEKVNVNGGAIALGHPLGATGARITTTLLFEMKRRNEQFGLATLCIGGGQGMAILLELLP